MKSKKGFTLIELLAVIVIIAIIALITTPVVLSSITTAQTKANLESARAFVKASEFYCATQLLATPSVTVTGVATAAAGNTVAIATVGAKGTVPSVAAITLNSSCVASGTLTVGGTAYTIGSGGL